MATAPFPSVATMRTASSPFQSCGGVPDSVRVSASNVTQSGRAAPSPASAVIVSASIPPANRLAGNVRENALSSAEMLASRATSATSGTGDVPYSSKAPASRAPLATRPRASRATAPTPPVFRAGVASPVL